MYSHVVGYSTYFNKTFTSAYLWRYVLGCVESLHMAILTTERVNQTLVTSQANDINSGMIRRQSLLDNVYTIFIQYRWHHISVSGRFSTHALIRGSAPTRSQCAFKRGATPARSGLLARIFQKISKARRSANVTWQNIGEKLPSFLNEKWTYIVREKVRIKMWLMNEMHYEGYLTIWRV